MRRALVALLTVGALGSCAHAPARSPCEERAAACPSSLSVCSARGETACLVQPPQLDDDDGEGAPR